PPEDLAPRTSGTGTLTDPGLDPGLDRVDRFLCLAQRSTGLLEFAGQRVDLGVTLDQFAARLPNEATQYRVVGCLRLRCRPSGQHGCPERFHAGQYRLEQVVVAS